MLVEKDYWIMHCLWGLQAQGFQFELKGGTSLSKGFGIIHRFSEDIDIRIEPPHGMDVKTGRNQDKPAHVESRRAYYDELAALIRGCKRCRTSCTLPPIKSTKRKGFAPGMNRSLRRTRRSSWVILANACDSLRSTARPLRSTTRGSPISRRCSLAFTNTSP